MFERQLNNIPWTSPRPCNRCDKHAQHVKYRECFRLELCSKCHFTLCRIDRDFPKK